jgi:negative regulator of flagellin synthesis FlgM
MTRIEGLNPLGTSRTMQGQAPPGVDGPAGDRNGGAERAEGRQDLVSLSSRGRIVAEAASAVALARDVRAEKVAALKAAIADGSYRSDAREIAERLLTGGGFFAE